MTAIYVAAKFEEAKQARYVMDILEREGYDITHDWTDESIEGLSGTEVSAVLQAAAIADIAGVQNADAVVVLHHDKLKGGLVEIGAGLGTNLPVIVVGGRLGLDVPIFYWHPDTLHVPHIDGALALLQTLFPEPAVLTEGEEDESLCSGIGCSECEECPAQEGEETLCPCPGCEAERAVEEGVVPQAHLIYFVGQA